MSILDKTIEIVVYYDLYGQNREDVCLDPIEIYERTTVSKAVILLFV